MRERGLMWWIVGAVVVVLLAGGGIAVAVSRSGSGSDEPVASWSASVPSTEASATPSASPGADITGPLDLVLLGVDTRVSIPNWQPHTDAIMLLHVDADLKTAYLYSLPRDLRVKIPAFKKAGFNGGTFKITEAMAYGSRVPGTKKTNVQQGYELLLKTLTAYTGIETFQAGAILNFGGLEDLVDELGGIDLTVDQKVSSHHRKPNGSMRPLVNGEYRGVQKVYKKGKQHLDGWEAIDYARQRYGLPKGDYDRQRHQRQMVEAILTKALDQGLTSDTEKLQGVITALGKSLEYVGGRSTLEYAYALRDLSPSGITLVNLSGGGVSGSNGYLGEQLNSESKGFLKAVANGEIASYLAKHSKMVSK